MAKQEVEIRGTKQEQQTFKDVLGHYTLAKEDLDQRVYRKNGFDDADKMFASYIDESNWPYSSLMFDPRPYTTVLEKSARLIGAKPKGRLVPREGGDTLGAYINNELLSFQWDDNTRVGDSMIAKWIMMDQNTRKYGSSFALVKWRYETKVKDGKKYVCYDGPDMFVCDNRHVLANPSYNTIKQWFQYRDYTTISELESINDTARKEPVYKNLDILRDAVRKDSKTRGDRRDTEYTSKNKAMRGLSDFMGRDELYKTIEVVTEYRPDRWITFVPRHGVVIRDIPNPYKHGEIPVVHLKYYPLPDDLYGVSEFEPVSKQIRAINAHLSAYNDKIALKLRPPIHVNPTSVRMNTIEWNPEAKWLMNNPNADVQVMKMDYGDDSSFQSVYSVLVSSLMNALGESSQGISNIDPFQPDKTATEVKDSSFSRNVRDNMNQIFLSEALKKQIMFWHSMNQQYLFQGTAEQAKVIRIVGRDAIDYFNRSGLADIRPTEEDSIAVAQGQLDPESIVPGPRFAVDLGDGVEVPKFQPDEYGEGGNLIIEPGDISGNYDYVPDIETMQAPSAEKVEQKLTAILGVITNPVVLQLLQAEGKRPKVSELLIKMFESTSVIKDAESYFEELPPQPVMGMEGGMPSDPAIQGGAGAPAGGVSPQGANPATGMGPSAQAAPGGPNPQLVG